MDKSRQHWSYTMADAKINRQSSCGVISQSFEHFDSNFFCVSAGNLVKKNQ